MSEKEGKLLATIHKFAQESPTKLAYEWVRDEGDYLLSYGGLDKRIVRLGHALYQAGYGDGARVALCLENRPAWPMVFLSVWYAGGVAVPIDTHLDPGAIGRVLRHSGAAACVTSVAALEKVEQAKGDLDRPPELLLVDGGEELYWDGSPRQVAPVEDRAAPARNPNEDGAPSAAVRSLDDLAQALSPTSGTAWDPYEPSTELGALMYTSGTTGDPKGVMLRREAIAENIDAGLSVVRFSAQDRILGILPMFHVLPLIANCIGPAYLGACVVILSELTAERIVAAFREHEITVFICVPAFFYRFHARVMSGIEAKRGLTRRAAGLLLWASRFARRRLGLRLGRYLLRAVHEPFGPQMNTFVTGGAKMNADVMEDFLDWGFTMAQAYGQTEATAILTISPLDDLRGATVGTPVPDVELKIHEPDDEGIGEIWARSPSLMDGYLDNPDATDAALVEGWLRTGDLGRLLPDGHLMVTGRAKDMIVLASGKNIYPEEVEEHYSQCELIEEMCIVGLPDPAGHGERLHAVVVPDLEAARRRGYVNVREMIKWELDGLGVQLPGSRRLTSMEIRTESLPRTTTRKVKRFQLLEEILERGEEGAPVDHTGEGAPRTPVAVASAPETKLSEEHELEEWAAEVGEIIARHAGSESVQASQHLDLDLGLESLDRVEMFAELELAMGIELDEEIAGELHTVAEVLEVIASHRARGPDAAVARADRDRWAKVLSVTPEGLEPYLKKRPIGMTFLWLASRVVRSVYRLTTGFRSSGQANLPQEYPYMVCPNHFSYLDPIALTMALPLRAFRRAFFVGYSEYFEGWFGSRLARWMRNVPIDQNRHLERAMQAAAEGLRRGMVLVIFPEGGRSIDGEVKEFRKGAEILSQHLDAAIVPVGIWGTYELWSRGGKIRRHPLGVAIGEPLRYVEGDAPAGTGSRPSLIERLRTRVVELVAAARALYD